MIEKDKTKLVDFTFPVSGIVTPVVETKNNTLEFKLSDIKREGEKININTYKYKLVNEKLAVYYVDQSLKSVLGTQVFGSGLPTISFSSPQINLQDEYLVAYES